MKERIPFRWPEQWADASHLEWLKGTPINCIVGQAPPPFPLAGYEFVKLEPSQPPEGVAVREGVWPRVLPASKKDAAEAGATGAAWVDSNAGVIRLAQALEPGKAVWLDYAAPEGNEIVPLERFARAVAEARAYGGHWIITLSPDFIEGLNRRTAEAVAAWKRIAAALNLFQAHPEWRSYEPVAALAVVSSFQGESELLAAEFVKLAPRRHLAYRVVRTEELEAASLDGFKAVIYIEAQPPEGAVRKKLLAFAEGGGLVIAPQGTVSGEAAEIKIRYRIHRVGKGRVAMPPEAWYDPYLLMGEAHQLLSHREDVVRVWNGSDMNSHFVATPGQDRGVVHLIHYGSGLTPPVTLGFNRRYRSARVLTLEGERAVEPVEGGLGPEFPVGEFASYAAVEVMS
jgi:hypothetical protein